MDDKVVERYYDEFLEKYREQWIKQGKLVVENFPFLTLTSALPFPSEIRVWQNELHLDGFIYLFDNSAEEFIRNLNIQPESIGSKVAMLEDAYYQHNLDECPYFLQANTFESFLSAFARDFEKLEEENTELRKRLGEDVSEPRDCPCFRTEVGPAVDDIPNEK